MENFETTQPSPEHRSMSLTGSPRRIPGIRHSVSVVLTLFVLALSSCSGGDDAPAVDTTPYAFSFTDQTNVAADRFIISNSILVASINAAAEISVSDGEYAIDGGAYTSTTGTVSNGQMVRVRHTASPLFNTMTTTFLSISGVSDSFTSTTGPVGTGFNQARGFNEAVYSLSPATDDSGDIYVGGGFTTYNDTASKFIIRLNSDGAVDTAFAVGSGFNGIVNSISPATDGSGDVYVGGILPVTTVPPAITSFAWTAMVPGMPRLQWAAVLMALSGASAQPLTAAVMSMWVVPLPVTTVPPAITSAALTAMAPWILHFRSAAVLMALSSVSAPPPMAAAMSMWVGTLPITTVPPSITSFA